MVEVRTQKNLKNTSSSPWKTLDTLALLFASELRARGKKRQNRQNPPVSLPGLDWVIAGGGKVLIFLVQKMVIVVGSYWITPMKIYMLL